MTEARRPDADELAEDTLGFARRELHTIKDLVLRPSVVLKAMMEKGSDGGGVYTRPLRLYIGLSGIGTLLMFLNGGDYFTSHISPERIASLAQMSGKSIDAFSADVESWSTLFLLPLSCTLYALVTVPLLRLWDPDSLGWKRAFRATFCWLSAWSILVLPVLCFGYGRSLLATLLTLLICLLGVVSFFRIGRGRWFESPVMGVLKGILLMILIMIANTTCTVIALNIGVHGAAYTS